MASASSPQAAVTERQPPPANRRASPAPISSQDIEPGGPIRPGIRVPALPQVRPNMNSVSMPRSTPVAYSASVPPPMSATTAPSQLAALAWPCASRRRAMPVAVAARDAFGWIDIPLSTQSVRRRTSSAQPTKPANPAPPTWTPAASRTRTAARAGAASGAGAGTRRPPPRCSRLSTSGPALLHPRRITVLRLYHSAPGSQDGGGRTDRPRALRSSRRSSCR
jgi:hypothetical protein